MNEWTFYSTKGDRVIVATEDNILIWILSNQGSVIDTADIILPAESIPQITELFDKIQELYLPF